MPNRHRSALSCTFAALVLTRAFAARGEELPARFDALVVEGIVTAPAQRAPKITEEILDLLSPTRAEGITLAAAPVYRIGQTSHGTKQWDSIYFDDTLRYLKPSALGAARVVEAVEQWDRVRRQTPKNEIPVDPLPRHAVLDYLVRVGAAAQPLLEASRAKQHGAVDVIDEALARLRS